ncbi:MAG: hypothetical protein K6A73_04845 [Bacteroidales bacterium]|nr:hypothetical protein [Bacteroidales bacterium]
MDKRNYIVGFLDEEEQWRLTARSGLLPDFKVVVLDLVKTPDQIWDVVREKKLDALIVDFRLFESGEVTYNGNDIIQEVQRHNLHFPLFIMTSYENDAFSHCEDVLIIRDKSMFQNEGELARFKQTLKGHIDSYYKKEEVCRKRLLELNKMETLTQPLKEEKYKIELYLSELDLDNSLGLNLLSSGYTESMEEILNLAKDISNSLKK